MGKRGPKKHVPTEDNQRTVSQAAAMGLTVPQTASLIGMSDESLRKYYSDELIDGKSKAIMTIGGKLYQKAKDGDTTAMIFYLKTQGRWSETNHVELSGGLKITEVKRTIVRPSD
jgi:hypothetical protein